MSTDEIIKAFENNKYVKVVGETDTPTGIPLIGVEVTDICIMSVLAGTNCPKGGDAGHGGVTVLLIKDLGSVCMELHADGKEVASQPTTVRLVLRGDAECSTFIEGMSMAIRFLKDQRLTNSDKET